MTPIAHKNVASDLENIKRGIKEVAVEFVSHKILSHISLELGKWMSPLSTLSQGQTGQ